MRILTTLIVASTLGLNDSAAQQNGALRSVADPVADFLRELPVEREHYVSTPEDGLGLVYRVIRDYNNDGRPDTALTYVELCGNGSFSTHCSYELYLSAADGQYLDVGALDGSVELDELVKLEPGTSRLLGCHLEAEDQWRIDPIRISRRGLLLERSHHLSSAEYARHCRRNGEIRDYSQDQCSIRQYLHDGSCSWSPLPQ